MTEVHPKYKVVKLIERLRDERVELELRKRRQPKASAKAKQLTVAIMTINWAIEVVRRETNLQPGPIIPLPEAIMQVPL